MACSGAPDQVFVAVTHRIRLKDVSERQQLFGVFEVDLLLFWIQYTVLFWYRRILSIRYRRYPYDRILITNRELIWLEQRTSEMARQRTDVRSTNNIGCNPPAIILRLFLYTAKIALWLSGVGCRGSTVINASGVKTVISYYKPRKCLKKS